MIDLRISQQFGKLGLDISNVKYELKQQRPDLEVSQMPAEVSLDYTEPDLMIDYTPMLESLGLGSIEYVARTYTNAVKGEYLANIEKDTQVGDQIASIENNRSIGEIVFQASLPEDSQIDLVAISPIRINYIPGEVKTQVELGGVDFNLNYGKISVENFTFPSIRAYMEQEPYLKIEAVGQVFDRLK